MGKQTERCNMFNIARQEIKKYIFIASTLSILTIPTFGFAEEEVAVTAIALRTMQTRQFSKPANEVVNAINADCIDNDGTGSVQPIRKIGTTSMGGQGMCAMKIKMPETSLLSFIPIVGSVKAMADSDSMMKSISRISYDVKESSDGKTAIVRMRAYTAKNVQVNDPALYAERFKLLGDAIFTEAIAINPASQE